MPDPLAPDPLADAELTVLLGVGFQTLLEEFVARYSAAGYADLRPMHGMVFQALGPSGLTSTELAESLGVTKQAAGQIVADLEARGYLERVEHPDGGRRRLVRRTPAAEAHLEVAGRVLHALEGEVASSLGSDRVLILRETLAALIRTLSPEGVPPLRPVW